MWDNVNHRGSLFHLVATSFLIGASSVPALGTTVFVDADADPGGNGLSWPTAFEYLQDALELASDPENQVDQIWVAEGTYFPDDGLDDPPPDPRAAILHRDPGEGHGK